ncbi:MAG: aldo/keto reductase [Burkholderiaceae bacterium]|jgi:predicted oxidoreductase|nr:aldo/keto reductase [Burkholderiaceae bacterium]MCZ8175433.1 aldo/keto reductase [Burkholderiaceae bacterium]
MTQLSPVVAGLWKMHQWPLGAQGRLRWIEGAVELGITSFDHADIYGGYSVEALFGEALALAPGLRQRLQIVTKCGIRLPHPSRPGLAVKHYDSGAAHLQASVDASLAALRCGHIDLLLVHRPDPLTHPDEIARCFERLRAAGKVREFGVSNHTPAQFAALHRRIALVTHQVEFSALQMKALADGTLEQAADLDLPPMIWSPLGSGRLITGDDEHARRVRAALQLLAEAHGVSLATVALAWVMRHPSRPRPITGSGRLEALAEAVAATRLVLDREAWTSVWRASMGHDVP